jgi:hypothetical protein
MIKDEHNRSIDESHASRHSKIIRLGMVWTIGLLLLSGSFAEALAQPQSRSSRAYEFLDLLMEKIGDAMRSGPPPSLDDLKAMKQAFCKLVPNACSHFPTNRAQMLQLGEIFSFPAPNASMVFYNRQKRVFVVLPPRALVGIEKAVLHLKDQDWESTAIAALLLPVSPLSLEAENDCSVYRSSTGYVRIRFEGHAFSPQRVSVKVIKDEVSNKSRSSEPNLNLPLSQQRVPSISSCSDFDEFEASWEQTFNL